MKIACAKCGESPLCSSVRVGGADYCEACGWAIVDTEIARRRARGGMRALSRLMVWAACEMLAQDWARHGGPGTLDELRALALRNMLRESRGLRVGWAS